MEQRFEFAVVHTTPGKAECHVVAWDNGELVRAISVDVGGAGGFPGVIATFLREWEDFRSPRLLWDEGLTGVI